jgi:diguanylate cyclase (GGDEF)-like protein
MACPQVETLLSAYIDGEATADDRELIELHLLDCPPCRRLRDDWDALDKRLRAELASRQPRVAEVIARVQSKIASKRLRRCSLLLVDDEPHVLSTMTRLLADEYDVVAAGNADEAQAALSSRPIDLLLTDQRMPRRTGMSLLEWAKQHSPRTIRLLMTGHGELDDAVEAINRGNVYHYLLKPFRTEELLQVLRNAADKFLLERKRERYLNELWELNRELERRVAARTRELEQANLQLQQKARELERLALTDSLTGLFNRRAMEDLAKFELKRHTRYPSPLALGYIDIDRFKEVNTRHLHTGGDEVLRVVARLLAGAIREVDSVGRVGGEEFLVIARETGADGARVLGERLRTRVASTPIPYHGVEVRVTVSLGFAVAEVGMPADLQGMTELAAEALSRAKKGGRNRCEIATLPRATTA